MSDTCLHCRDSIHQDENHGWVHSEGGSQFAQRCEKCGKLTAQHGTPRRCPHCRQPSIFHLDHTAEPAPTTKSAERSGKRTLVGRGDGAHVAAIVSELQKKVIQPDSKALRHLAPRRHAPRWLG